jgi:hypothetical protein
MERNFPSSDIISLTKRKRGNKDMYLLLIRNNIVSNGQKKWEEILALGLDETKWREILYTFCFPACLTAEIILLNFIIFFEMLNFSSN